MDGEGDRAPGRPDRRGNRRAPERDLRQHGRAHHRDHGAQERASRNRQGVSHRFDHRQCAPHPGRLDARRRPQVQDAGVQPRRRPDTCHAAHPGGDRAPDPALFHYLAGPAGPPREGAMSLEISVLLVVVYGLALLFSLHTHERYFTREAAEAGLLVEEAHAAWSVRRALGVLVAATVVVSVLAEILVGAVEPTAEALGMTEVFIGVIVVAIVGNAAEHSTAILMAVKDRMDLSLGIAIGSATQIALFAAPVLVLLSYVIGPEPMDLVFTTAEVVAIAVSVIIVGQVAEDGESNWLEGVQLLAVYLILGVMFYFLPEASGVAE